MSAIAEQPKKTVTLSIRDHLESPAILSEMAKVLPSHMTPERMARVAITAMTRTPDLAKCTQQSFFKCLLDLSSWGLEPDGRRAHLIPFKNNKAGTTECQLIIDYKGIVELCFRSGFVKNIHADVVRDGDLFEFNLGKVTKHTPWAFIAADLRNDDAGEIIAAYCVVEMKDGAAKHEVMTRTELDGIRKRSKASSSGPWVTDFSEMCKKTVFRRASKWLPLSSEMHDAFERDFDRMPPVERNTKRVATVGMEQLLGGTLPEQHAEPETSHETIGTDGKLFAEADTYGDGH